MRTRREIFHIAATISLVIMLTISPIVLGKAYSVEYTGQTSNTGNNVQSEYFTACLYKYNPPANSEDVEKGKEVPYGANTKEYFESASAPFSNGRLPYTTNTSDTTRYEINNARTELTDGTIYLLINDSNIDESTYYTATCNVEYNHPLGESNTISGNETLTLGNDTKQLKVGTAYMVSLYLFEVYYSGESDPKNMTISISITVSKYSKNYSGTYSSPTESITIVEETELDQWVNELKESNNEENNPSFNKDIDFVVDDGNGDEPAGIFIQNSASPNHSIATGDSGQIDVVMSVPLPPNKSFYLYITIDSAFLQLTASSDISITIKKENNQNITFNKSVSINNKASWGGLITGKSINTYVYLDGGNNLTSSDTAPSNSNYCISYVEGDIITISFSGTENAAIGNQSMTVTAKLCFIDKT